MGDEQDSRTEALLQFRDQKKDLPLRGAFFEFSFIPVSLLGFDEVSFPQASQVWGGDRQLSV